MKTRIFFLFLLCILNNFSSAQTDSLKGSQKLYFTQINFSISAPLGLYASPGYGGALAGYGMELGQYRNLGVRDFFITYSLSYTNQPYELLSYGTGYYYNISGTYNNIDLHLGLGFRTSNAGVAYYLKLGGGLSYSDIGGDISTMGYDDALNFGISAVVGVVLVKHLNIGLRYCNSNPTFKYWSYSVINSNQPHPQSFSDHNTHVTIAAIQLIVGIDF